MDKQAGKSIQEFIESLLAGATAVEVNIGNCQCLSCKLTRQLEDRDLTMEMTTRQIIEKQETIKFLRATQSLMETIVNIPTKKLDNAEAVANAEGYPVQAKMLSYLHSMRDEFRAIWEEHAAEQDREEVAKQSAQPPEPPQFPLSPLPESEPEPL